MAYANNTRYRCELNVSLATFNSFLLLSCENPGHVPQTSANSNVLGRDPLEILLSGKLATGLGPTDRWTGGSLLRPTAGIEVE